MHVRAKSTSTTLPDLNAARQIALGITKHQGCVDVLEVGPGTGALTRPLLNRGDLDVRWWNWTTNPCVPDEPGCVLPAEDVYGVDLLKWDP